MKAIATELGQSPRATGLPKQAPPCISFPAALPWAFTAVITFHAAWSIPNLQFLIVVCLVSISRLAALRTARQAFYTGLAVGYAMYAPHLEFLWTIFGWPAAVLWVVLAFWLGLFVALARLARLRLGRAAGLVLLPFLWTGLEYFRSELYYLRFSWLSVGYVFAGQPQLFNLTRLGVYGIGFVLMTMAAASLGLVGWRKWAGVGVCALMIAVAGQMAPLSNPEEPTRTVRSAGIQLDYPFETDLLAELEKLAKAEPSAELVVLSEYTLQNAPSESLKDWCRRHHRYLVIGGKDFVGVSEADFYNTVFVIDPSGEIVFRQAKSVPIQFFRDGLPAKEQALWESPWGRIGFCICYDASYQRVTDRLVAMGMEALLLPTADDKDWGANQHNLHARIAPVRAAEYGIPVFKVACTGISQWVNPEGTVLASASYPGYGEVIRGTIAMGRPGRRPFDHWVGPGSAAIVGLCIVVWTVQSANRRFRRG